MSFGAAFANGERLHSVVERVSDGIVVDKALRFSAVRSPDEAVTNTVSAIAAALWLGGLWFCTSAVRTARDDFAGRLRAMAMLGVAIPLLCAIFGVLNAVSCWAVLVGLAGYCGLRRFRGSRKSSVPALRDVSFGAAIPMIAVTAVSWPGLVRPVLDGDSLSYHLPNSASWVTTGSLWTTTTAYWWYPGGSELFDAGLLAAAGPASLAFGGFVALMLLGQRLYAIAREADYSPWSAGAVATAVVTVPAIAIQGATLQNDIWLAAFTLETIWAIRTKPRWTIANTSMLSLIKPVGFIIALFIHFAGQSSIRVKLTSFALIGAWFARDLILMRAATLPIDSTNARNIWSTTIAAHGSDGMETFIRALLHEGPGLSLLFALSFLAFGSRSHRLLTRTTAFATALFFFEPFGFTNGVPQLASGASLRFLFPALVLGVSTALPRLRRLTTPIGVFCFVLAAYQITLVRGIFYNDASTHGMPLVVVTLAVVAFLSTFHAAKYLFPVCGADCIRYA